MTTQQEDPSAADLFAALVQGSAEYWQDTAIRLAYALHQALPDDAEAFAALLSNRAIEDLNSMAGVVDDDARIGYLEPVGHNALGVLRVQRDMEGAGRQLQPRPGDYSPGRPTC